MSDVDLADVAADGALRAGAFVLLARLLGPRPELAGPDGVDELDAHLAVLGVEAARLLVARARERGATDHDALLRARRRLLGPGRTSPYETSYTGAGAADLARLADVSGFYRAFGFQVSGERPDHFVAELELAAFLALGEARARHAGDGEGAAIFADAFGAFLRDHLGTWLRPLADRLESVEPGGPYAPLVGAAAHLVEAEAERVGIDLRPVRPLEAAIPAALEEDLPSCGGCPGAGAPPGPVPGPS
ncbi:MAG: molecular chaperone TorD family protein [Acidimicrobiia bacterium]|nr:molecular chaperone TorD family protein [Acidimicrobiia bacterium]